MTTPRRKVVLYGNRQMATFAQAVLTHDSPYEVVAFTVDDALITETTLLGLPVVPFENVERLYPPEDHSAHIAVGFRRVNGVRAGKLHQAALDGSSARPLTVEGEGFELAPMPSPDGKWLTYVATKTRREEVCLRRLDGSGASWQLSSRGAGGVRWGRDTGEVFLVTGEILCRVPLVASGGTLTPGQPEELFEVPPSPTEATFRDYDYDRRTDRFLFTRSPRGTGERREIALSLGWAGRLKEKVKKGADRR